MKKFLSLFFILLFNLSVYSQELLRTGPMVGYSAMREVSIWTQTIQPAKVKYVYWNIEDSQRKYFTKEVETLESEGCVSIIKIDKLEPGQKYNYEIFINGKKVKRNYELKFQTQELWQWRKDPPSFSFAAGSCAYINETIYDRPGNPYGGQYKIFQSIYEKKPDFMLWLGDNIYLREVDWDSWSGIIHRYTHTRSALEMQPLFGSVHNYAIWDDHDFGPNNSDRGWWNKEMTLKAFKLFWPNQSYGVNGRPGTTSYFSWADVDFFLMDNRYYRTPNDRKTETREMFGDAQIQWLIDNLVYSRAPFKVIVTGGQFLNPELSDENHTNFPFEKEKILKAIEQEGIEGVIFLTGDVHRTEITKMERDNNYPLYDFTMSPLTSSPSKVFPNSWRIESTLVTERNFGIFEVSGQRKNRTLSCSVYDSDGKMLWTFSLNENDLKIKK